MKPAFSSPEQASSVSLSKKTPFLKHCTHTSQSKQDTSNNFWSHLFKALKSDSLKMSQENHSTSLKHFFNSKGVSNQTQRTNAWNQRQKLYQSLGSFEARGSHNPFCSVGLETGDGGKWKGLKVLGDTKHVFIATKSLRVKGLDNWISLWFPAFLGFFWVELCGTSNFRRMV